VEAAQGSKEDKDVFNATYGLIFFGTPTRGLEIQSLCTIVKGQPNEELVRYLGASRYLKQQHDEFYRVFTHHDSQIISVFETKMTPTVEVRPYSLAWARVLLTLLSVRCETACYREPGRQS
jgi:hypothetical protein